MMVVTTTRDLSPDGHREKVVLRHRCGVLPYRGQGRREIVDTYHFRRLRNPVVGLETPRDAWRAGIWAMKSQASQVSVTVGSLAKWTGQGVHPISR